MSDPITLLVSAVTAGAAIIGKEVVTQAVKDAYTSLKTVIVDRYGTEAKVEQAIQVLEEDPGSQGQQMVLTEQLQKTAAVQDSDLGQQAQVLLKLLEETGVKAGSVHQAKLEGSGAIAQGPGAVAAGAGGIAIGGNASGNISTSGATRGQKTDE